MAICEYPTTKNSVRKERVFSVCGPAIWNSLPPDIHDNQLTPLIPAITQSTFITSQRF